MSDPPRPLDSCTLILILTKRNLASQTLMLPDTLELHCPHSSQRATYTEIFKPQFLGHNNHISSAQETQIGNDNQTEQHRQRTFHSLFHDFPVQDFPIQTESPVLAQLIYYSVSKY